jgi:hypothetical protein
MREESGGPLMVSHLLKQIDWSVLRGDHEAELLSLHHQSFRLCRTEHGLMVIWSERTVVLVEICSFVNRLMGV